MAAPVCPGMQLTRFLCAQAARTKKAVAAQKASEEAAAAAAAAEASDCPREWQVCAAVRKGIQKEMKRQEQGVRRVEARGVWYR